MWVILQPVIFLIDICSQTQPTRHDATAAKESHMGSLPHSTSEVLPAQGINSEKCTVSPRVLKKGLD